MLYALVVIVPLELVLIFFFKKGPLIKLIDLFLLWGGGEGNGETSSCCTGLAPPAIVRRCVDASDTEASEFQSHHL